MLMLPFSSNFFARPYSSHGRVIPTPTAYAALIAFRLLHRRAAVGDHKLMPVHTAGPQLAGRNGALEDKVTQHRAFLRLHQAADSMYCIEH